MSKFETTETDDGKREAWRYGRRKEAADYLGISVALLAKLATTGGGPPYSLLGNAVVYAREDLDAWFAARRRTSTSQVVPNATGA